MAKNLNVVNKKTDGKSMALGREVVDMNIKVTPETKTIIEAFAKKTNVDPDVAGGVIVEYINERRAALEQVAREKVTEIFEKLERLRLSLETLLTPEDFKKNGRKGPVN